MRIIWDDQENRFLAELTPGEQWRDDKDVIQNAGFRTDGPPDWQWHTSKAATLNKLRDLKPKSGITLTEVALEHYKQLLQKEEQKAALKKQFKDAQKTAKKESKDPTISGTKELVIPEKGYIDASDLPLYESKWVPWYFPKPDVYCFICGDPLYLPFPDYPDVCLFCDKQQKENT